MPPYRAFSAYNADYGVILGPIVVGIAMAVAIIFSLLCVGEENGRTYRMLCSNKLHKTWTGHPPDEVNQWAHPTPKVKIRKFFDVRKGSKNPKFCVDCVAFAHNLLTKVSLHFFVLFHEMKFMNRSIKLFKLYGVHSSMFL